MGGNSPLSGLIEEARAAITAAKIHITEAHRAKARAWLLKEAVQTA